MRAKMRAIMPAKIPDKLANLLKRLMSWLSQLTKKQRCLIVVAIVMLVLVGAYFLRAPVLVVTDPSFNRLYGRERQRDRVLQTSLKLYRRLIVVPVSEQAGSDTIVIAVEHAARVPFAVLFPYRYVDAASLYKDNYPNAQVLLMMGRTQPPPLRAGITVVRTNVPVDLYRAGLAAAFLAAQNETEMGRLLFFDDENTPALHRQIFLDALSRRGFTQEVIFRNPQEQGAHYDIVSAVLTSAGYSFMERESVTPIVLFSWINPAITPSIVKVIFDDSPLAVAAEALRASSRLDEVFVPSRSKVMFSRLAKGSFRLWRLVHLKIGTKSKKTALQFQ